MNVQLRRDAWNWLPVVAEIADAGSVGRAAQRLALTPAAVSRTLRLVEAAVGAPLFNRVGRRLVLNSRGAALRDAVREAIAAVERGLTALGDDPFVGPLRVSSLGVLTEHFVVPALIDLARSHPALVPEHWHLRTSEALAALARGEVDVAFSYEDVTAAGVVVERLGTTTASVYCGRGHPLFGQRRIRRADILAHRFSVPQVGDTGRIQDGWPAELNRQIGMRITLLRSNLEVGRAGVLLTVLPDVTAAADVAAGMLRVLPGITLPRIALFAARSAAAEPSRGRAVIDRVKAHLDAANQQLRHRPRRAVARER